MTRTGWLSWRDYRWMWAYRGLQALLLLALIIPTFTLYWPAKGLVWAYEQITGWREGVYVRCYNHDLARRNGMARKPGAAKPEGWLP